MDKSLGVEFSYADESWAPQMEPMWRGGLRKNFHLDDGFSIVAHIGKHLVGFISACWRELPAPLDGTKEAFIDFIGISPDYRRQGAARRLVQMAVERAKSGGACQLRAWSSADKIEAIPMWKSLGFGLCPADPRDEGGKGYYVALPLRGGGYKD